MIGIYRIYHKKSGKSYVGKSVDVENRIHQHFSNEDRSYSIRGAIDKHGSDAFAWEILEVCCKENLDFRECHWIATLDCIAPNGYNLTAGGDGGIPTAEIRQKMSEKAKGRAPWNKGKKTGYHTEDTKRKMSESHKKHVKTDEHIQTLKKSAPRGKDHYAYNKEIWNKQEEIVLGYMRGHSHYVLADKYGVSYGLIYNIIQDYFDKTEEKQLRLF